GLSGGGADRIYLGDDDIYSLGLSVTQPLFTGGALFSAHGAARHGARAGLLNVERTEDQLRFDVTQAYVAFVQARAALDVMEDMVLQMESHLSDVEAFFEEGMLLESEVMLARVRMSQVELERSRATHMTRLAESALAFVLGIDVDTEIEPVDPLDREGDRAGDLSSLTSRALHSRPDLQAMGEFVGAADNGVSLARSGFYPQLVAMGSYNWDRPNREYEPEFYEHWSATLALSMNVFDWGLTGDRVREARAGLARAERGREMFESAVRLEVKQSYLSRNEALDALAIADDGLAQAREGMRVVREAFKSGVATNSNVLDAQAALTTAEMNRVAALSGLRIAEAQLTLATGGASRPEETE
ncbi:MAG: TolC family protein, partial [Candidatus Eisenbacteria sp.]|nr:TolC family protein [Candidatus Eisenbacteria bacterium]